MLTLEKYNFKCKALALCSILFALFFSSCEEVVNVDLETGPPRIVVDAEIIWEKGTAGNEQVIKISRMAPYYSSDTPKVSGAQVRVENRDGIVFTFIESAPGVYVCHDFVPVIDMDYTLHVGVDGQKFTAVEKLTAVTSIDRIEQEFFPDLTGPDLIMIRMYFKDPADKVNYYLTDFKSDFLLFPDYGLSNDEYLNGNEMNINYGDPDLKPGKILEITHRGISKNFHNYMNLILQASNGNPFSAAPGNIRGNLINTNEPDNFALGYFRLCEADHFFYTVK